MGGGGGEKKDWIFFARSFLLLYRTFFAFCLAWVMALRERNLIWAGRNGLNAFLASLNLGKFLDSPSGKSGGGGRREEKSLDRKGVNPKHFRESPAAFSFSSLFPFPH